MSKGMNTFMSLYKYDHASLVAQLVKDPPEMWETWAWSLGWEDPLEKEMATHSNILAWRILRPEKPGGLRSLAGCSSRDRRELDTAEATKDNI